MATNKKRMSVNVVIAPRDAKGDPVEVATQALERVKALSALVEYDLIQFSGEMEVPIEPVSLGILAGMIGEQADIALRAMEFVSAKEA